MTGWEIHQVDSVWYGSKSFKYDFNFFQIDVTNELYLYDEIFHQSNVTFCITWDKFPRGNACFGSRYIAKGDDIILFSLYRVRKYRLNPSTSTTQTSFPYPSTLQDNSSLCRACFEGCRTFWNALVFSQHGATFTVYHRIPPTTVSFDRVFFFLVIILAAKGIVGMPFFVSRSIAQSLCNSSL